MLNVTREQINPVSQHIKPLPCDVVALVLQGGGALGAYQAGVYEGQSKDYEFGLNSMRAHWQSGLDDIHRTLEDPRRLDPPARELGIVTHDVHRRD